MHTDAGEVLFQFLRPTRGEHRAFVFSATGRAQAKIIPSILPRAMPMNPDGSSPDIGEEIAVGDVHRQIFRHRNRLTLHALRRGGNPPSRGGTIPRTLNRFFRDRDGERFRHSLYAFGEADRMRFASAMAAASS